MEWNSSKKKRQTDKEKTNEKIDIKQKVFFHRFRFQLMANLFCYLISFAEY